MSQSCPSGDASFPVGVWTRIADHMSSREWARVSGTCQTTLAVRLTNVKIHIQGCKVPGGDPSIDRVRYDAGVKWACKMLPAAVVLSLPAECADVLAETIKRRARPLARLQQLHLDCDTKEYKYYAISFECLPWLINNAENLSLLDAHLGYKPWLPALKHIKHLILVLQDHIGNVFKEVPEVMALETLSITGSSACSAVVPIDAPLVLDSLPCLVSVALKAICPTTLSLPKNCKLSLLKFPLKDLKEKVWQGKETNLCSIVVDLAANDMSGFTNYVGVLQALVNVKINLPTANASQDSVYVIDLCCLKNVKKLHITGKDLDIIVPSEVSWDDVSFNASDTLRLQMDTRRLIDVVPRFAATFRDADAYWIAHLPSDLTARQEVWGLKRISSNRSSERPRYKFWYSLVPCNRWCCCGACMECLVAEGKAVTPK